VKPTTSATFLALSCVGSLISTSAMAADAGADASTEQQTERERRDEREQIIVNGQHYQTQQESPKSTRPVRDTPQTVTVITGETIEQQNLLTLRDMLSTVPGITFGAAEGGSPPADSINFRGYSAGSDITQDGVRDSAAYSRSDSFNLEQLEIVNGANSVQSGAGSVGGSINIVTKRPLDETRVIATGGIGTDNYYRGTVDANMRVNDLIAVRLNAMAHKNDVPGRDFDNYKRWGIAPSVSIGMNGPTKLTLQYLHQEDDNLPQYGVPYYDGLVPGVDRSDYFGYRNVDRQDITVDQATAIFEHDLSDTWSVRNLARWQQVSQLTVVGPPQGTYCLSTGVAANGGSCTINVAGFGNFTVPNGYYYIGGPRGNLRDSRNELMYDQVDLRGTFNTGAIEHTLVIGASALWEKYTLNSGNALRNADGTPFYARYPLVSIANPNEVVVGPALPAGFTYGSNVYDGPVNFTYTGRTVGEVDNYSLYLFDAMKIGKFEINGGVRYEKSSGSSRAGLGIPTVTSYSDNLFSYRLGLVYKPVEAVTLYAAFGNSKTPSQSSVNGSCSEAAINGNCSVKPEGAKKVPIRDQRQLQRQARGRQELRNRRKGRGCGWPPVAERRGVPQRARQLSRQFGRCRRARPATRRALARRWHRAERGRPNPSGLVDHGELYLPRQRDHPVGVGLLSCQPRSGHMYQFGRRPRSGCGRAPAEHTEAFGQPVHDLRTPVRAEGRLWRDVSGQI
jgi:catecholate siderophore receptor